MKQHANYKNDLQKLDNNLTYIVGYRNLYNICILMIGFWSSMIPNQISVALGFGLIVLGFHWFLDQCRENIDSIEIGDTIGNCDQPDYDKASTSKETIRI